MEDVVLDKNMDLSFRNGDFIIAPAVLQNQALLIEFQKGELKQHPETGVGAAQFLLEENKDDLYREIRRELVRDEMKVKSIYLDNEIIKIDADYD